MRSKLGMVWIALAVVACSSNDSSVSCSPTLTCTYHDARFAPPPKVDAGPAPCDPQQRRCRAIALAAGGAHSCAIARAGELLCWGSDADGQLGRSQADEDAGTALDLTPVLTMATRVAAGAAHTCAIVDDGRLYCFGRDDQGQVSGVAAAEPVLDPRRLELGAASEVAAGGAHSCAIVAQGVVCWGNAAFGQVGRQVVDAALGADLVSGTSDVVEVVTGLRHSCARRKNGHVLCWGELIDVASGEPTPTAEATEVPELDDATALAAGAGHSCAVRKNGRVVCWGVNASGQLGDGTKDASAKPVLVTGLQPALRIAAGGGLVDGQLVGHSCAVDRDFYAQCWGRNVEGQLGIGEAVDATTPQPVLGLPDDDLPYLGELDKLAAGAFHTCALDSNNRVLCWGDDHFGQLGARQGREPSFGRVTRAARFSRFE